VQLPTNPMTTFIYHRWWL